MKITRAQARANALRIADDAEAERRRIAIEEADKYTAESIAWLEDMERRRIEREAKLDAMMRDIGL